MSDDQTDSTVEPDAPATDDSPFEIQPLDPESKSLDFKAEARNGD